MDHQPGVFGFVGLVAWTALLLLPSYLFLIRYPVRSWATPEVAPLAILSTLLGIYIIDCLMNAFPNLVYGVATGGLIAAMPSSGRYTRGAEDLRRSDRLTPRGRLRSGDDGPGQLAAWPDGVADTPDEPPSPTSQERWPDDTSNWRER